MGRRDRVMPGVKMMTWICLISVVWLKWSVFVCINRRDWKGLVVGMCCIVLLNIGL